MNSVIFILYVYEIEGKNTVSVYIDKLKKRMEEANIEYKFKEAIGNETKTNHENESIDEIKNMNKSVFEKFFDSIGTNNNNNALSESHAGFKSIELEIYSDVMFNNKSMGLYELNNCIEDRSVREEE